MAAELLIKYGHRKIAYISGVPIEEIVTVRQRYFGYCKACKDHGATAICTENDYVAINLERNCREMGVGIPEQLSLAERRRCCGIPIHLSPDYGWADGFRALVEEMSM